VVLKFTSEDQGRALLELLTAGIREGDDQ
jgi:hypothetical protein